jgi:hypothetical protein
MTTKARLEWENVAKYTNQYTLLVRGDDEVERRIEVARITQGGMTLVNYEVSQRGEQQVLSAFFYINIMGHDLDQWLHFDLETGARIEDYINPMQAANRRPEKDRVETEEDRRLVADKLKIIINRWGDEREVKKSE